MGFHSKNIFANIPDILKLDGKVLAELNTYMAAFDQKEKDSGKETFKNIGKDQGFVLDDQSSKFIWKYIFRPKKQSEEVFEN